MDAKIDSSVALRCGPKNFKLNMLPSGPRAAFSLKVLSLPPEAGCCMRDSLSKGKCDDAHGKCEVKVSVGGGPAVDWSLS